MTTTTTTTMEKDSKLAASKEPEESANTKEPEKSQEKTESLECAKKTGENANQDDKPLSKNARKRQKRWQHKMEVKRRRKEHEKATRWAMAKAQGRDLEKERQEQEERTKNGEGHRRREELMLKRLKSSADASFRVCLDCAFEEKMTFKEINSLSSQIRYCYASNKKSRNPIYMSVSSLGGTTRDLLTKVAGFPEQWYGRGFACSDKDLIQMHSADKDKLVYLTSDSENILDHLEDDKVYVIGGIVDRNRLKGVTLDRANELSITTAKLPITEHLHLFTTKVLTCNHVFEILLKCREHGNDWKKAMLDVLPVRKDAQPIKDAKAEADTTNSTV